MYEDQTKTTNRIISVSSAIAARQELWNYLSTTMVPSEMSKALIVALNALNLHIPKQVTIREWTPAVCPTCDETLSEFHGDGRHTYPTWKDECPNCHQRLSWHCEKEN